MRCHLALVSLLLALVACGGSDAPPPAPVRQPTPLDLATTGTISGQVRFEGTPPPMKEIRFGSFAECSTQHPGAVYADDALVHDGKVQNAFVYIADGLGNRVFAIPDTTVEIDQRGCLYVPHVAGAQVGQLITFANGDPAIHNVHGTSAGAPGWNFVLARKGAERQLRLMQPDVAVGIRCDLHPWMQAWIGVVDHPYFAVTGPDGTFRLVNVPPGTYTVTAWHEKFGTRSQQVTLAEHGEATADLAFSAS
jgi:plastocyanin